MTKTLNKSYQWTSRRILIAAWFVCLAALIVIMVYPVSHGILRLFTVTAIPVLWLLAMFLTCRVQWLSGSILGLGLIFCIFVLLPGRTIDPVRLRNEYLKQLKRYEGSPYVWGGENRRGIDCSGLVRRALIDSHVWTALVTANPEALRAGINMWWHDCSALALRDQYRNYTIPLFSAQSINTITSSLLMPGDIAVTSDGVHVLAYLGNQQWIEADLAIAKVIILSVPSDNVWLTVPVKVMRWKWMNGN